MQAVQHKHNFNVFTFHALQLDNLISDGEMQTKYQKEDNPQLQQYHWHDCNPRFQFPLALLAMVFVRS